jgi:hypothetical protein
MSTLKIIKMMQKCFHQLEKITGERKCVGMDNKVFFATLPCP